MTASSSLHARMIQVAFVVALFVLWYVIGATGAISPLFLPPIQSVVAAFAMLVQTAAFWSAVGITLRTVGEAYAVAVLLGIAAGYAVTRSHFLTRVFEPIASGLFAIPITLFLPLFILLFGIGPPSKVAYGATYAFFPIVLNTIAGLSGVDRHYVNAARTMGLSGYGTFRHVLLPSAFPVILTGLRIGFFICFASVLGGETISSVSGVGRNIALAAELMEPARMYAWIVFVIATALVLNTSVSTIETRMRRS